MKKIKTGFRRYITMIDHHGNIIKHLYDYDKCNILIVKHPFAYMKFDVSYQLKRTKWCYMMRMPRIPKQPGIYKLSYHEDTDKFIWIHTPLSYNYQMGLVKVVD